MSQTLNVDKDAFSSGQIGSKLWLCEHIEDCFESVDVVWIYGGWYGITAFLLRSRNNIPIKQIRSIDIDPACEPVADMINENWVYQDWQFKAVTKDCNTLDPMGVDLVINTSTEHFNNRSWWHNIPKGTMVALQGNNMPHTDHHVHTNSLEEFKNQFNFNKILFEGTKEFVYPDWKFVRFMIIGEK